MKKLLFTISIAVIASLNILAQGYRNPVLPGFHAEAFMPTQVCVQTERTSTLSTARSSIFQEYLCFTAKT